jgi:hypothetical protein
VIKKAKTLINKEKTGEFTPRREKDQLNAALEYEEGRVHGGQAYLQEV